MQNPTAFKLRSSFNESYNWEFEGDTSFSYYRARYYDSTAGRFISEDPLGFESGQNDFYSYLANSPIGNIDPSGLAHCTFTLGGLGDTGLLICLPDKAGDPIVIIPANSGNNGDPQHHCRNNPACPPNDHGPLPLGWYQWGGPSASHATSGGKHLKPVPGTGTSNVGADGRFLTHSCPHPFGPSQRPSPSGHFCSEGCIVSTPDNIKALNGLLNAEPGSIVNVLP